MSTALEQVPDEVLMGEIATAIAAAAGLGNAVIPNPYPVVNQQEKPSYYPPGLPGVPVPLTFSPPGPSSTYFGVGKTALKQTKKYAAVCDVITATTAQLLLDSFKGRKLQAEVVGYTDPNSKSGHVFLVVNRDTSQDINSHGLWGQGFAVDVWWAKQRADEAGSRPVKSPTGSAGRDDFYFKYLSAKTLAVVGTFTT